MTPHNYPWDWKDFHAFRKEEIAKKNAAFYYPGFCNGMSNVGAWGSATMGANVIFGSGGAVGRVLG